MYAWDLKTAIKNITDLEHECQYMIVGSNETLHTDKKRIPAAFHVLKTSKVSIDWAQIKSDVRLQS